MATLQQLEDSLRKEAAAGNTENQQRLSDAIRQHPTFQANAQEQLASQEYRYDENFNELDKQAQRKKMGVLISRSLGVADDEVDVSQGMGHWGRLQLSMQPTQQDKIKHLKDNYGDENIRGIDVGGDMQLLYRDENETGGKWRRVDEEGVSLADFTSDIAGDVAPTAASVVGGVAGFAAGGIPGSVAGAALAGGVTRAAQDVATRVVSGEPIQGGDIAKRATTEAVIGAGADVLTLGAGKFLARRAGKDLAEKATKGLVKSEQDLARYGVALEPSQRIGGKALDEARQIAKERPGSAVGRGFQRQADAIARLKQASEGNLDTASFGRIMEDVQSQNLRLAETVEGLNKEAGEALRTALDREMAQYAQPRRISGQEAGEALRDRFVDPASEIIERTSREKFDALRDAGEGVTIPRLAVRREIQDARKLFDVIDDPKSKEQAVKLWKESMSGNKEMTFNELRETIDLIGDSVSQSKLAGFGTAERVASRVLENLRGLRGDIAKTNPALADAYDDAINYYKDRVLLTKRSGLGRTTKEQLGDAAATPSQAIDTILGDPEYVDQLVRATGEISEGAPDEVVGLLRERMLSKLGFSDLSEVRKGLTISDKQKDVLERLYGGGSEGKRKVRNLESLQKRINQAKGIDLAKVRASELDELLDQFATDDVNRVSASILRRMQQEAKQEKIINNSILKQVTNDKWTEFDSSRFAQALINADNGQVREAWKKVPSSEKKAATQEAVSQFFKKYSSGAVETSGGDTLWNHTALAKDLAGRGGDNLRANMDTVFGKQLAKEIVSANNILEAGAKRGTGGQAPDVRPRFTFSPGNIAAYFVGDLAGGIKHRFMGWAYGSDALVPLLRALKKDVGEEQTKKNMEKLLVPLLSAGGMASLAREAGKDPNFDENAQELMTGLK